MIRLRLETGPVWHDLGLGVRVEVLPITSLTMNMARRDRAFLEQAREFAAAGDVTDKAAVMALAETDHGDRIGVALAKAVARRIIVSWEGVLAEEGDAAAPVTPEGIDALLDLWPIFDAFQKAVLEPAIALESEKNGFAPSLNGISAGAGTTAKPARKSVKPARRR